jgi:hypothetical protein
MYNGTLFRIDTRTRSVRRIDQAISSEDGYWSTPIAISPVNGTTLYSARRSLYRTDNPTAGSPSWERLTPGNSSPASALGLSPHDAGTFIIGTVAGEVYSTIDNGVSWRRATGMTNRFVTDLYYDPNDENRIYATVSGYGAAHVYRSSDKGRTFVSITGNLPDVPVNAFEINPDNSLHMFVGTGFRQRRRRHFVVPVQRGLPDHAGRRLADPSAYRDAPGGDARSIDVPGEHRWTEAAADPARPPRRRDGDGARLDRDPLDRNR